MSDITFKRSSMRGRGGRRKRKSSSDSNEENSKTVIIRSEPKRKANPLIQGTNAKKFRKIAARDDEEKSSGSEEEKTEDIVSTDLAYKSGNIESSRADKGATSTLEIDTEFDRDARAVNERAIKLQRDTKGEVDDKIYRGMAAYDRFIEKKDTSKGSAAHAANRQGPMRAPVNVRVTTRWDYEPSICKDFKETGFCGFGDSCKYLHDRSDYKAGWLLEQEVKMNEYGEEDTTRYEIESDDEEDLPFKCFLCRESFKNPIVTKCNHYFCEQCALQHFREEGMRCFVCGKNTRGIFNPAKTLMEKLDRKLKKEEEERALLLAEQEEEGVEVNWEDDDEDDTAGDDDDKPDDVTNAGELDGERVKVITMTERTATQKWAEVKEGDSQKKEVEVEVVQLEVGGGSGEEVIVVEPEGTTDDPVVLDDDDGEERLKDVVVIEAE